MGRGGSGKGIAGGGGRIIPSSPGLFLVAGVGWCPVGFINLILDEEVEAGAGETRAGGDGGRRVPPPPCGPGIRNPPRRPAGGWEPAPTLLSPKFGDSSKPMWGGGGKRGEVVEKNP